MSELRVLITNPFICVVEERHGYLFVKHLGEVETTVSDPVKVKFN